MSIEITEYEIILNGVEVARIDWCKSTSYSERAAIVGEKETPEQAYERGCQDGFEDGQMNYDCSYECEEAADRAISDAIDAINDSDDKRISKRARKAVIELLEDL